MDRREQALNYLKLGYSVIPLVPKGKKSIINWFHSKVRLATKEKVEVWYKKWPDANIGIVTGKVSGLAVIDVDSEEAMKFVQSKGMILGPMVKSSRGYHLYCKYREGVRGFQTRADLPGIDLRAEGNYIVAPPSVHETGHVYGWVKGHELGTLDLPDLPEWILAKRESERKPLKELHEGVIEGERHKKLVELTGLWIKDRLTDEKCLELAMDWNKKNKPPLDDKELKETVEDCVKRYRELPKEYTSFLRLEDGRLAEMIYDKKDGFIGFAVFNQINDSCEFLEHVEHQGKTVHPLINDNLIIDKDPIIWLPSDLEEYGTDKELYDSIKKFIHKYVGLDECFEVLATTYVMFSWVYDCYNVLPYLRVLGDFGTGKSRFLYTIGLVCYKPMVIVSALGEAPLFRIIQKYRGTLVLDEANFKQSDTNTAIIQILNAGYEKKASVIRCTDGDFDQLKVFRVFSPKIISSRAKWKDSALESRCITWMSKSSDRLQTPGRQKRDDDIPLYLDDSFNQEALSLRNKLLLFRFRNFGEKKINIEKLKYPVEARISQILLPLANLSSDEQIINEINNLAKQMHKDRTVERSNQMEAHILQAIKDIEDSRESKGEKIYLKEIADNLSKVLTGEREVSAQTISAILRSPELMINLNKKDKKGISIFFDEKIFQPLFAKYGIIDVEEIDEKTSTVTSDDCDDLPEGVEK